MKTFTHSLLGIFLVPALPAGLGAQSNYTLTSLPSLFGFQVTPYDINNAGVIAGYARTASETQHGFSFFSGTMYDLNDLVVGAAGWEVVNAQALNDLGQIVGTATFDGVTYGVLLSPISAVPKPATYAVFASLDALGLAGWRRRRPLPLTPLRQGTSCLQLSPR